MYKLVKNVFLELDLSFYLSDIACALALKRAMSHTWDVCFGWSSMGNKSDIASQHTLGVDSPLDTAGWGNGSALGWCSEEVNGTPLFASFTAYGRQCPASIKCARSRTVGVYAHV